MNADPIKPMSQSAAAAGSGPAHVSPNHAETITELFNRYHTRLVKSLVARTRSWEDAREIAAQAFTQLLSLERPGTVSFIGAYLYRTARNIAEDRLRHRAMCNRKGLLASYDAETSSPSAEPALVQEERFEILQGAIERLRPRCRMALILRMWDELPYDGIVNAFATHGISVNERTIRRYVAEGLECCRRAILAAETPQHKESSHG